jgi:hypothetical protein
LLGTQQCEEHIGSALARGYLYAAVTPMSIFGSLGVARAGFKTLIACLPGRTWSGATGATILANMGFEPKGTSLSLVMIDKDNKDGQHLAETRLDELVKELHIDKSRLIVSHKCTRWNVTMILLTAFLSSLSMIPYIHINRRGSNLRHCRTPEHVFGAFSDSDPPPSRPPRRQRRVRWPPLRVSGTHDVVSFRSVPPTRAGSPNPFPETLGKWLALTHPPLLPLSRLPCTRKRL